MGLLWGALAGVVATLTMDLGGAVFRKLGVTAGAPPAIFGKWFGYLARGRLAHDDIALAPEIPVSLPAALLVHYAIGVVLALGFTVIVRLAPERFHPGWAVVYGVGTSVFAWFVMFPSMGYGVLGLRGPPEWMLLRTSLVNHVLYGLGLALFTLRGTLLTR